MERIRAGTSMVGCAGWSIPGPLAVRFPEQGSQLERYAQRFGVVEINSSFYRAHRPETYARWADSVPPDFRFAVKLPKQITHELRLQGFDSALDAFSAQVAALGPKLGCILVQLPPSLGFEHGQAFEQVRAKFDCMIACEARHPDWFASQATALLTGLGVTRVIADPPKGQPGPHMPTTSDIYVRLHGSPRVYFSSYSDEYLSALADDLRIHAEAGRQVWLIFDNTASGAAMANALQLKYSF